jgi:hypothetical protein
MVKMEMFFVIFGFTILGTFILNENKRNIMSNELLTYMQFANNALAIADSYMERFNELFFDENVTKTKLGPDEYNKESELSNSLGKDSGESDETTFDDVDDYHNFSKIVSVPKVGDLVVNIRVYYYDLNNLKITTSQSFYKLAIITVRDTVLGNPNIYFMGDGAKKYEVRRELLCSHYYLKE